MKFPKRLLEEGYAACVALQSETNKPRVAVTKFDRQRKAVATFELRPGSFVATIPLDVEDAEAPAAHGPLFE